MKKFYFLTLALICAFAASAYDLTNASFYFAAKSEWNYGCTQVFIGHDSYSMGYAMTKINGTNLYYKYLESWGGYTGYGIMAADVEWGGESQKIDDRIQWGLYKTPVFKEDLGTNKTWLAVYTGENNGTNTEISSYSALNHTQTVNVDGVGSVTVSSVKLSSASGTTTTLNSATVDTKNETSTASTSIEAAYTATVTCVAAPGEGESFVGWYDENEQELSNQETYTYNAANADKTITAKFSKLTGIEEVGVDAGAAVYYNLQGVKVANPENGIFIKKQGNKTTKVVL